MNNDLWLMADDQMSALASDIKAATKAGNTNDAKPISYITDDGVAVMQIHGPMFSRGNFMTELLGLHSTADYIDEFLRLEQSHDEIMLYTDGPGGQAGLMFEFADLIRNSQARTISYTSGMAASAHLLVYMSANERYAHDSAQLGSMGVIGVTPYRFDSEVVSRNAPNKIASKEKLQTLIDSLENKFVSRVADQVGLSEKKTISAFDKGGIVLGSQALESDLIQGNSNLKGAIELFNGSAAPSSTTKGTTMTKKYTEEELAAAVSDAVTAQNQRWEKLLSHDNGSNTEAVTRLALESSMSLDTAISMMAMVAPAEPVAAAPAADAAPAAAAPVAPAAGDEPAAASDTPEFNAEAISAAVATGVTQVLTQMKASSSDTASVEGSDNAGDQAPTELTAEQKQENERKRGAAALTGGAA